MNAIIDPSVTIGRSFQQKSIDLKMLDVSEQYINTSERQKRREDGSQDNTYVIHDSSYVIHKSNNRQPIASNHAEKS